MKVSISHKSCLCVKYFLLNNPHLHRVQLLLPVIKPCANMHILNWSRSLTGNMTSHIWNKTVSLFVYNISYDASDRLDIKYPMK